MRPHFKGLQKGANYCTNAFANVTIVPIAGNGVSNSTSHRQAWTCGYHSKH